MKFGFEELDRIKLLHSSGEAAWVRALANQLSRADIFVTLIDVDAEGAAGKASLSGYEGGVVTKGAIRFVQANRHKLGESRGGLFGLMQDYHLNDMISFSKLSCVEVFIEPFDVEHIAESVRLNMAQASQGDTSVIRFVVDDGFAVQSIESIEDQIPGRVEISSVQESMHSDALAPPGLLVIQTKLPGLSSVDVAQGFLMDAWNGTIAACLERLDESGWALQLVNREGPVRLAKGKSLGDLVALINGLCRTNHETRVTSRFKEENGVRELVSDFGPLNAWVRRFEKRGYLIFGCGLKFDNGARQLARTLGSRQCRQISSVMKSELERSFASKGVPAYRTVSIGIGNKIALVASKADGAAYETELSTFMSDLCMFFGASVLTPIGVEPARVKWSVAQKHPDENVTNFLSRFRR